MVLMRYIHLFSFTRYADDIFHIMSSFHRLDNKKCRKSDKFLGKLKKMDPAGLVGLAFSNSEC